MNVTDGSLEFGRAYRNFFDGISGLVRPNTVSVSPDGNCLYVVAIEGPTITAFQRMPDNALVFAGSTVYTGGASPWQAAVSPDGAYLYISVVNAVAGYGSLDVAPRDQSSCTIGPPASATTGGPRIQTG